MLRKSLRLFVFSIAFLFVVSSIAMAAIPHYKLSTSAPGGTWYPMGVAISELWNKNLKDIAVVETGSSGGSTSNTRWISSGEVDLAFVSVDMFFNGRKGQDPYKEPLDMSEVRSILLMHGSPGHFITLEESDIESIDDLRGKKVSLGDFGGGTNRRTSLIFDLYGIDYSDIQPVYIGDEDACNALLENRIDAIAEYIGAPSPAIYNLSLSADIKFIDFEPEIVKEMKEKYPFFATFVVPPGTYEGIDEEHLIYGPVGGLYVREEIPDEVVYTMTKAIYDNLPELEKNVHQAFGEWKLSPETSSVTQVPLHPGAEKFYKEEGIID